MEKVIPIVGQWYQRPGRSVFEVVAIDEQAETIELQHFDGTVDELDMESWNRLIIQAAEPPEDYSGSLDLEERDDYEAKAGDVTHQDWADPLEFLDHTDR